MAAQSSTAAPIRNFTNTAMKMAELSLAQVATYAFPLIFAVVCARNLGPANYGVVAFYTALTALLGMFIEWGLDPVGVREVHAVSRRDEPEQVMWNVTLCKVIVCLLTCIVAIPILLTARSSAESSMAYAMLVYLIGYALDTSWYLRSLELMRSVMLLSATSRLAGIILLLLVVRGHEDMGAAMWTYAFVAWANAILGWLLMRKSRVLGKPRLDLSHLHSLFKSGGSLVVGNLSTNSITSGGIVVLGALADPVLTGAASMALRIRTVGVAALMPLLQLGIVRLSALIETERVAAVALGRRLFYALMAISLTVAWLIIINADLITALAYGLPVAPEPAGVLVRLLAISLPAGIAGYWFGFVGLTLFKRERVYMFISLVAAAIFFGLLLSSNDSKSPDYGWAILAAETWIFLTAGLYLRRVVKTS